jgi:hypothetical protein
MQKVKEIYLKKANQRELKLKLEELAVAKHNRLISAGLESNLENINVGFNPEGGAVSMYIEKFPVQIQLPSNGESVHLVSQYEHLYQKDRFRGYDTSKYNYEGCWIEVLPKIKGLYGLGMTLPDSGREYKVHLKSNKKDGEAFLDAAISLLNKMSVNKDSLTPKKPKEKK